jgi:hypothetical protein
MDEASTRSLAGGILRFDLERRRLWVGGQRLHHGLTGVLIATAGLTGFAARRFTPRGCFEAALLGTALMAHDWADRAAWFKGGVQD